jgi:hypothetical protein
MEITRMKKSVRRVVLLQPDGAGGIAAQTLYEKETDRKNKKQQKGLKEVGKGVRRLHNAARAFDEEYLRRHDASNRKKRDGWARELPKNLVKATRKGVKKVEASRWI